jgi:hypothetical protein
VIDHAIEQYSRAHGAIDARARAQADDERVLIEAFEALVTRSIWARRWPSLAIQMRNIAAMGVALLVERGLINTVGLPIGLCTLIARLSYIEPANFFLARLFQSGKWSEFAQHWQLVRARLLCVD